MYTTGIEQAIKPMKQADIHQEEVAIMEAARQDIRAFEPLYDRYFPRIYAYCRRRTDTEQDAEDLTAMIFTRALTYLHSYRGGMVAAWLFRIAHNTLANFYRNRKAFSPVHLDEEIELESDFPEPLEQVLEAEEIQEAGDLVALLPPEQQNLLALKLVAGLTSPQIAEIVGKNPGAVRTELHRIFKQLRQLTRQK